MTSFGQQRVEAHGLAAEGGPVEAMLDGGRATVLVQGGGRRKFTLPSQWEVKETQGLGLPPTFDSESWVLNRDSDAPATIRFARKPRAGR